MVNDLIRKLNTRTLLRPSIPVNQILKDLCAATLPSRTFRRSDQQYIFPVPTFGLVGEPKVTRTGHTLSVSDHPAPF